MFGKETYVERRSRLKSAVGSGLLVFLGNDECGMNYRDNTYSFRQDSTFLYYFGLSFAGLSAVIDIDEDREIIFGDELTIDDIVWMGTQPTLKEKAQMVGVGETRPAAEFADYVRRASSKGVRVHVLPPYRAEHELKLASLSEGRMELSVEFIKAVVDMRIYKTEEEIAEIERACNVTADMHIEAYRMVRPGMKEYEVAAAVEAVARRNGCMLSFPTIATVCGQTLHNHCYEHTIKEGDMLLLDAGAETAMGYAGDMSSTVCAGKKFSRRQKDVYDVQVAAHTAAVEALKPGVPFEQVYDLSCRVICEGMKDLGLMKGNAEDAVKAGAHAMFFPCGLGHMMGLDVHDMEGLGQQYVGFDEETRPSTQFGTNCLRMGRRLEEGFVVTDEPGIYFIPALIDDWRASGHCREFLNFDMLETYKDFGGIRIEDDLLITKDGCRFLGQTRIPYHPADLETFLATR